MIFRRKRENFTGSCFVTAGVKGVFATQVQKKFFRWSRAETPEELDGFVIMREGDSSARKRTSLYMKEKISFPETWKISELLRKFVFAFH